MACPVLIGSATAPSHHSHPARQALLVLAGQEGCRTANVCFRATRSGVQHLEDREGAVLDYSVTFYIRCNYKSLLPFMHEHIRQNKYETVVLA